MPLTTTEEVQEYLSSKGIVTVDITPITGGTSNYIWRLTHPDGYFFPHQSHHHKSSIFKHAEPHLSASPDFAFSVERMGFEVQALHTIPGLVDTSTSANDTDNDAGSPLIIHYPQILHYDPQSHLLILSVVGAHSLQTLYPDPSLDVRAVGVSLGTWLARLHCRTKAPEIRHAFRHETAKKMYRWSYNSLAETFAGYGFDRRLGERVNERWGSLLESDDDECICHTDLWPGNILLDLADAETEAEIVNEWAEDVKVAVIDWEVARNGVGGTDVGHFAGEAWFLDRWCGGRGLLEAFLRGYINERSLLAVERERVVVQFGVHVSHWPTIYKWIDEDKTKEAVAYGYQVLKHVEEGNWAWFREGDLRILLEG